MVGEFGLDKYTTSLKPQWQMTTLFFYYVGKSGPTVKHNNALLDTNREVKRGWIRQRAWCTTKDVGGESPTILFIWHFYEIFIHIHTTLLGQFLLLYPLHIRLQKVKKYLRHQISLKLNAPFLNSPKLSILNSPSLSLQHYLRTSDYCLLIKELIHLIDIQKPKLNTVWLKTNCDWQ